MGQTWDAVSFFLFYLLVYLLLSRITWLRCWCICCLFVPVGSFGLLCLAKALATCPLQIWTWHLLVCGLFRALFYPDNIKYSGVELCHQWTLLLLIASKPCPLCVYATPFLLFFTMKASQFKFKSILLNLRYCMSLGRLFWAPGKLCGAFCSYYLRMAGL